MLDDRADDTWFEGDAERVFNNSNDRFSEQSRSTVHPLFSLLAVGFRYAVGVPLHLSQLDSVRAMLALEAMGWLIALYAVLRLLECRRIDSIVFSVLATSSAALLFWCSVPETYLFGSLTILCVMVVTAWSERRPIPAWLDVGVGAAALSITITNWMAALISLSVRRPLKQAIQLACNGLLVVVLLWGVEKSFVHGAIFFLGSSGEEAHYLVQPHLFAKLRLFFLDPMVMPDFQTIPRETQNLWPKLSVQDASSWHLTRWGSVALIAWIMLLCAGAWALATVERFKRFRLTLALTLLGQFALHLVYGAETFLYVLNWLPLLVIACALGTLTRLRIVVLALAVLLIVTAALHNLAEWRAAVHSVVTAAT
jgi:hypothetical protein